MSERQTQEAKGYEWRLATHATGKLAMRAGDYGTARRMFLAVWKDAKLEARASGGTGEMEIR